MIGQVFEMLRTTTESSMRMQREAIEQLFRPRTNGAATPEGAAKEAAAAQTRWLEFATSTLSKQGELLDSAYRTGAQLFEQMARLAEAKSPSDYGRLAAELWRKAFDAVKTQSEAQMEELKRVSQFWVESAKR